MNIRILSWLLAIQFGGTAGLAQDLGGAVAIGARAGATHYLGDGFDSAKQMAYSSFYGEHFLRDNFSLETALNVGEVAAKTGARDFRSYLAGLSLVGRLGLGDSDLRPYVAGGVELLGIDPEDNFKQNYDRKSFAIPAGAGLSIGLSENVALDLRGLYHYAFEKSVDGMATGTRDSFISGTAGLTWLSRANQDPDADGLFNHEEKSRGTNPKMADTDGDGLNDGNEVKTRKSDPLKTDTDSDGLKDGEEISQYETNPLKADTDDGTVSDSQEIKNGTNPLIAYDDVPKNGTLRVEAGAPIVLEGVVFKTASATISPESESTLEKALNTLEAYPAMKVEIHGHTDNTGSPATNMALSQARAEAVKAYLVQKGISADRIVAKGFGPDQPIASNDTKDGRRKNRRIEFVRIE